ncbi:MAG: ATP-dependent helicase [Lewinellaceae bacterium]|nr:ATP-dependent helicase [Lewinellaceae bacterium]
MPGAQPNIQHYNEAFLRVLEELNPQQRQAVDQVEGPVLAIAGPGTGKTHILSARIGRILLETDAQAQNILCLTFTDAGVNAMRQRLLEFIGPEAHRVHIYTFHSFCNSIIQDNLELFGSQDMEPLSELERVEIIRQLLDELEVRHPLRRGRNDAYFYEKHLQGLFQLMKSEDWTVEHFHDAIDSYLESLPDREEFIYQVNRGEIRKGALKEAKVEDAQLKMERLRAAAALFPNYQAAMERARRYDYDDMILWVLEAFKQNEALLRNYQEQYLYFLIDEYQDTNGAQNEIIRQLAGYWDQPNIFIVGDDDQSIYEFQGARLKNLTDFYEHYQESLQLVVLADNYRSSQHILDSARALIGHNHLRIVNQLAELGLDKLLLARHPTFADSSLQPEVVAYPNPLHEEGDIVAQLKVFQEQGFPLSEVAVIYAKHRQADGLIALLEKHGIPYSTKRRINILDLPLIRNLRQMLEYFAAEFHQPHSGEHLLFRLLHFTFFHIAPNDLARLSNYMARQENHSRPHWREVLMNGGLWEELGLEDKPALHRFSEFHDHILRHYASLSAPAFVERLINRSGLLKFILGHEEKNWLIQVLATFLDFVKTEAARNPRLTVGRLLDIFRNMDGNRLALEVNKTIQAEEGVQLVTAHSAKGLEFQKVFLLDCISNHWEPRNHNSSYQFSLPDTLTYSGEEDALEARRRLFYVAMTRAREGLHISYTEEDKSGKPLRRAIFVDELLEGTGLKVRQKKLPPEALLEAEALRMLELEAPAIPAQDKALVDSLLEGFQLSVSAMNRYLRCPLSFYYENVLRAPEVVSEAAYYGTAMHNALQRLFERMKASKGKAFPPESAFIRMFEQEMERMQGYFARKEYQRRLEMGRHNLSDYYRLYSKSWHKDVLLEYRPRQVEMDGVPLTGSIDKLELLNATTARIVDYKTGSQNDGKLRRPSNANPQGGSFWRQLVFYKILYESHPANTRLAKSGVISYLEPNGSGKLVEKEVAYTPEDVQQVKGMIRSVYEKIMVHDFYSGCGEANCPWCNFVRHNELVDSFSEPEVEELDD